MERRQTYGTGNGRLHGKWFWTGIISGGLVSILAVVGTLSTIWFANQQKQPAVRTLLPIKEPKRQQLPKVVIDQARKDEAQEPTPDAQKFGWDANAAKSDEAKAIRKALPKFKLSGPSSSAGKKTLLWEFSTLLLGQHLPTFRQEIGDCVSMGAANACNYLQCVEICTGDLEEFHAAYQPYIYGMSRGFDIGKWRIGGDGSVGVWAAEAVKKYGILRADFEGVPAYSGSVAKQWGRKPGPPAKFIEEAKTYPIQSYAQVNSYNDVRDAIDNGYPVTIASNVGFEGGSYVADGKLFLRRGGSWGHQMALIGVDDTGSAKGCYCINSWGANAHPTPLNGEPPGGFWISSTIVDAICKQGDSFAYSSFQGFPLRDFNFDVLGNNLKRKGLSYEKSIVLRGAVQRLRLYAGSSAIGQAQANQDRPRFRRGPYGEGAALNDHLRPDGQGTTGFGRLYFFPGKATGPGGIVGYENLVFGSAIGIGRH